MKRIFLALPFSLAMGMAATSATANTGTINFVGVITSTTCNIEIIDPVTGNPGSGLVNIGSVAASQFTAVGQERGGREFGLRLTPGAGCTVTAGDVANVTFSGVKDPATGNYFQFKSINSPATGVVGVIKDDQGTTINNGVASKDYDLDDTNPTDMRFSINYRSTAATVTAGGTEADVRFSVAIN